MKTATANRAQLAQPAGRASRLAGQRRCCCVSAHAAGQGSGGLGSPALGTTRLVATVAAAPAAHPPATSLQQFGRATWPFFALLEALALTGAIVNGISSRKRRLEIAGLNEQLRSILLKVEAAKQGEHAQGTPVGDKMGAGKRALLEGRAKEAAALFTQAGEMAVRDGDAEAHLSSLKGLATAQQRAGLKAASLASLLAAAEVSKGVTGGVGDSAVYGLLGDAYTEAGDFDAAGRMYDACLQSMD